MEELICSQEDAPGTHKSPREIEHITGIARSSVQRIVKNDLAYKSHKRLVGQKLNDDCSQAFAMLSGAASAFSQ